MCMYWVVRLGECAREAGLVGARRSIGKMGWRIQGAAGKSDAGEDPGSDDCLA